MVAEIPITTTGETEVKCSTDNKGIVKLLLRKVSNLKDRYDYYKIILFDLNKRKTYLSNQ